VAAPLVMLIGVTRDEDHAERLVRGRESSVARFGQGSFPIPRYAIDTGTTSSLYDLQELYRKGQAAAK
jgi:hypothetical protein